VRVSEGVKLGVCVGVGRVMERMRLFSMSAMGGQRRDGQGDWYIISSEAAPGTRTMFCVGWRCTLRGLLKRAEVAGLLAEWGAETDARCNDSSTIASHPLRTRHPP